MLDALVKIVKQRLPWELTPILGDKADTAITVGRKQNRVDTGTCAIEISLSDFVFEKKENHKSALVHKPIPISQCVVNAERGNKLYPLQFKALDNYDITITRADAEDHIQKRAQKGIDFEFVAPKNAYRLLKHGVYWFHYFFSALSISKTVSQSMYYDIYASDLVVVQSVAQLLIAFWDTRTNDLFVDANKSALSHFLCGTYYLRWQLNECSIDSLSSIPIEGADGEGKRLTVRFTGDCITAREYA